MNKCNTRAVPRLKNLGNTIALIFNKTGAKVQENLTFGTIILTFFKNWVGGTSCYGCYGNEHHMKMKMM